MFPVETISAKMLDYYVDRRDSLIIDLREREEFNKSHVRGAVNIPYEEADSYALFPKDKILVMYCDRGGASSLPEKDTEPGRLSADLKHIGEEIL